MARDGPDSASARPSTAATPPASSSRAVARGASRPPRRRAASAREAASAGEALDKRDRPPTWRGAFYRAMFAAVVLLLVVILSARTSRNQAIGAVPDRARWLHRRSATTPTSGCTTGACAAKPSRAAARRRRDERCSGEAAAMRLDVRSFTVGPVQENAYIVRARRRRGGAVLIDPGDEPERLLGAIEALGVQIEAILITHCHFDHIGAVAPVARATGAPVYCPEIERPVLEDIDGSVRRQGSGRSRATRPTTRLAGGERLEPGGPGHRGALHARPQPRPSSPISLPRPTTRDRSPATCSSRARSAASTCPAATGRRWSARSRRCCETLPPETTVYPGHMGVTTLGRERDTNPFLVELARPAGPAREQRRLQPDAAPTARQLSGGRSRSKRRAAPSTCSASRPRRAPSLEDRARAILEGAGL